MKASLVYTRSSGFEDTINARIRKLIAAGNEIKSISHAAVNTDEDGVYFSAIILYDTPARGSHVISE